MKKFWIVLLFICQAAIGQVQRLAILPTTGAIEIGKTGVANLATICIDLARDSPYNDVYNYFHTGQNIPIKVNGKEYPGGLKAAIEGQNPILRMSAYDESALRVKINPVRKDIKKVEIGRVETFAVVGTKIGDNKNIRAKAIYDINPQIFTDGRIQSNYWTIDNKLKNLERNGKIKPGEVTPDLKQDLKLFTQYADVLEGLSEGFSWFSVNELGDDYTRLKQFQKASILPETGKFDEKTLNALNSYRSFLKNVYKDIDNNLVADLGNRLGNDMYLVKTEGIYSVLTRNNIWKRRPVTEQDIDNVVNQNFNYLKDDTYYSKDVCVLRVGPRNIRTQKAGIFTGSDFQDIDWTRADSYEEVISAFDKVIQETPDETPIVISRDELHARLLGKSDNVGSKFISESPVIDRQWINPAELMKELKAKYPTKHFYLSRGIRRVSQIKSQPRIRGPKDVAAYIASKDEGIKDEQLGRIKDVLREGQVNYYEVNQEFLRSDDNVPEANILLVSGHKDANFEQYLKALADNGKLEGKVVGIFSCFEKGTTDLQAYLVDRGYANNVVFFPMRISTTATEALLREITALLPKVTDTNKNGILLDDCVMKAVDNLLSNTDYADLKTELEPLRLILNLHSFNLKTLTGNGRT